MRRAAVAMLLLCGCGRVPPAERAAQAPAPAVHPEPEFVARLDRCGAQGLALDESSAYVLCAAELRRVSLVTGDEEVLSRGIRKPGSLALDGDHVYFGSRELFRLAKHDGAIVSCAATFGWGKPGAVRRSSDGATWQKALEGTTFGGMVFDPLNAAFVATSRSPQVSLDKGKTWAKSAEPAVTVWNVRGAAFAAGNVVMMFEDSVNAQAALSKDAGKTWWKPSTIPSTCGKSVNGQGGIVYGKDTLRLVGGDGTACRSTDGGQDVQGREDGRHAANNGWMQWYEKQSFYRSKDGVTWDSLPKTSFVGSHPIRDMAYGRLDASACK